MSRIPFLTLIPLLLVATRAQAIGPKDVYLLTNRNEPASKEIAEHYCQQRGVPKTHILTFDLPTREDITRADYEKKLAEPLRKLLKDRRDKATVLLSIYGVPLRVGPDKPTAKEKERLTKLKPVLAQLQKRKKQLDEDIKALRAQAKKEPRGKAAETLKERQKELRLLNQQIRVARARQRWLSHAECKAAVDSELALLWHGTYPLQRWIPNPLYFQFPEARRKDLPPTWMTARLDGPTPALVKGIIDQSVAVEKKGLQGKVYVDARGIGYRAKGDPGLGYGGYDESLREMARLLEKQGKMKVILDNKGPLFAVNSCPDCALYCGWYSLARFVDCCRFVPGAVAYHIASAEAVSLRKPKARYWCKNLLEKGAVATLGPVGEPYTIGFPKPAEFFGMLATGKYTLVECYWKTNMLASWMGVLVGDPLYHPFQKNPRLKLEEVKPSPKGGSVRGIIGS